MEKRETARCAAFAGAVAAMAALCGINPASATEGGGGHYPNGAENFYAGAVPPPGLYLLNYTLSYHADRFNDANGRSAVPNFDLKVKADTLRFLYMTPTTILGANYGMHLLVPLLDVDVKAAGMSSSKSGLGDITFDPFILAWHHSKNFHTAFGLDFIAPTGSYDKNRLANPGRNYWTVEPLYAISYLADSGFEASAKFMYAVNSRNRDTDVKSGQEFHADYAVGWKFGQWSVSANGYYYHQTTDDKLNGASIGNRGRAFAVGPGVMWEGEKLKVVAAYQHETSVKNRPEGDNFWVKLIIPF
jgi:hypothetical protein